eukprot:12980356-Ditylum_brightwellii.AAC.1
MGSLYYFNTRLFSQGRLAISQHQFYYHHVCRWGGQIVELGQGQITWTHDLEEVRMAHNIRNDIVISQKMKGLTLSVSNVDMP